MKFKEEILNSSGCASSPDHLDANDDLKKCGGCMLCKLHLDTSTKFTSSVTNETFTLDEKSSNINVACTTKNVVYLITCDICKIQYVGMTVQQLRCRFDGHRTSIKGGKLNTYLVDHFTSPGHSSHNAKVQIIYHYPHDDDDAKDYLLTVEEFYMRKLATLSPFGLNDKITSMNINLSSYDYTKFHKSNTPFFSFASERRKRSHGHRKPNRKITPDNTIEAIDKLFGHYNNCEWHDLYVYLRSLSLSAMEKCLDEIKHHCGNHPHKQFTVTKYILAYRSQFVKPPANEKIDYIYCNVPFLHKVIEKIGVNELLKCKDLKAFLPHSARNLNIRTTYSYGPTVGKKILNYNKILRNVSNVDFKNKTCDCKKKYAAFVYEPHGHVHTGKLDIIENIPLRNIMSMGAKYRLTPLVSKTKLYNTIEKSLAQFKRKLSKKAKLKEKCLDPWFDFLIKKLKTRIKAIDPSEIESNDIFQQESVKRYLNHLHKRFVIVPVDKASNNYSIICRQFYLEVLMKELGIQETGITGNDVYQHIRTSQRKFFIKQEVLNKELGNCLKEENKHIPLLYWTSKQHKDPYKFRFIAGASHCTNKTISVEVALALKCIKTQFKNYCAVIKKNTGLNYFWSIDNSMEFLNKLSTIPIADSITTFDFSTLYTNLPLDNIYESLKRLLIKMFKNSGSVGIMVNADRDKSFWFQGKDYAGYKIYTLDKLLDALKFILYNTYVQFGGNIFKQIKGIPMGGNASPFIADLYLAWHEFCFMNRLMSSKLSTDHKLAKILSANSRYLDDIAVINYLNFGNIAKQIYHPSLVLEGSTTGYHYDTFLDLQIRIYQKRFVVGIYHKVDDFNFEVISFPFPSSNIHSQLGYNTFYSQLVRFFRLCNNVVDFSARVKITYLKLFKRGYSDSILYKYFIKFCNHYPAVSKYGMADSPGLWNISFRKQDANACVYNDVNAIKTITKPLKLKLRDIYYDTKMKHAYNLKACSVIINDISDIMKSNQHLRLEDKLEITNNLDAMIRPIGLQNPQNHCYINSVLQILQRVLLGYHENIHINDNVEGTLVNLFLETCNQHRNLTRFKQNLSMFDSFFDGRTQRDTFECLLNLLDIFHLGTKKLLIVTVDNRLDEDEFTMSLTKSLFAFNIRKRFCCSICNTSDEQHLQSQHLNLYPAMGDNIQCLINLSLTGYLSKRCAICLSDTRHKETSTIVQPPKFMVLVINRYPAELGANKNNSTICMNKTIGLHTDTYQLIGFISHHGPTTSSGHYTCFISYTNAAFSCNDSVVRAVDHLTEKLSKDAYIAIYKHES